MIYAYRKSFQPFPRISGSAIYRQPVACTDSKAAPQSQQNTYSVQLNVVCQKHWIQAVVEVVGGVAVAFTTYVEDAAKNVLDWKTKSLPFIPIGSPGDSISFDIVDDGSQLVVFPEVNGGDKLWTNLSHGFVYPIYDKMVIASAEVVGQGNASVATFTSGDFECNLITDPAVDDLDAFVPDFLSGESVATLCARFPDPPPGIPTNETSDLKLNIEQLAAYELKLAETVP